MRSRIDLRGWLGAAALAAVLLPNVPANAATVEVAPGQLAAALAAAAPGDVLHLPAGTYQGPIVIDKPLTLEGEAGATIVGDKQASVITIKAPDVTVRGITIRDSGRRLDEKDSGVFLDKTADRALIEDNDIEENLIGVFVWGPHDAVVRHNKIRGLQTAHVNERGNGVQLWNTPGSRIEDNDIRFGRDGIFVTTSMNNVFSGNHFEDVRFAIHYMYTHNSVISGNVSIGNHVGYALMYSEHLTVRGNHSSGDRDHGILLNFTNNSTIEDNDIDGSEKCVFIFNANVNVFRGNRFADCEIGIHFTAGSERNTISGNGFIASKTQVKYVGTRWVEWSADGKGNFWSDNSAFDLDGDGIADTPYRPNDIVDEVLWTAPLAKLLVTSPAVQVLHWAQSEFPALHPGGVVDSHPLMAAPRPTEQSEPTKPSVATQ